MPNPRPNLLFLMADHQRADSLGMVQAGLEVTPQLNQLAARSTTFSRAYTTCPLCVPARTALATGLPPHANGVVFNDWRGNTAGDHLTMHEVLAREGYRLGHVGVHHTRVAPALEERVDFAAWYTNEDYQRWAAANRVDMPDLEPYRRNVRERTCTGEIKVRAYSNTRTGTFPYAVDCFKDWQFAEAACRFIERSDSRPFALFVCLWAPHPPLIVPEPYARMFAPEQIELPANVGRCAKGEPEAVRLGVARQLAEGLDERDWRAVWAAHLGLVRLVDDCIGRILQATKDVGQEGNTVVVFTTDHGEHLGAHCMYQKMEVYEDAVRVPLVVSLPGCAARSFDGLVSHLDLMPTIADMFGCPRPDHIPGRSLLSVIDRGEGFERHAVFSGYSGNPESGELRRGVVGRRFKYIWHPAGGEELYDLQTDPGELVNLVQDREHRAHAHRLAALGRDWGLGTGDEVWRRHPG